MINSYYIKILSLVLLYLAGTVLSCGMLTHIEISQRALHHFTPKSSIGNDYKSIIRNFPDFFTAGSPFPDWGYMCDYNDAAEAAHWPPFIHSYIEYLNKNYKPTDDRYKQMVSFLFGIESHGEADVIWHWGKQTNGTDLQGYLRTMSHMASDCKDIWEDCHGVGDTGADLYLSFRGNLSWMAQSWRVPLDDLYNIYQSIGLNVPKSKLWACPEIMYTGTIFERLAGEVELFNSEIHSAFLTEDLDLYFSGGLDDMALNVQWQWDNMIKLIENTTNITTYDENLMKSWRRRKYIKKLFYGATEEEKLIMKRLIGLKVEISNGVLSLSHNHKYLEKNKQKILEMLSKFIGISSKKNITKPILKKDPHDDNITMTSLTSDEEYSYFGKSLAKGDFNGDGVEEIVVGAPGFGIKQLGAIYIINNLTNINYSDPNIVGKAIYGRFGYSVAVADLNHDGYDDLIVSAPTSSSGNGPSPSIEDYYPKDYNGRLNVYYGGKNGIGKNADPNLTISSKNTSEIFFNLGKYLYSSDCNNDGYLDLLVGSPHSQQGGDNKGHIAIFLGVSNKSKEIFIEDADYTLTGNRNYSVFGSSMTCGNNTLIIGAPGYRFKNTKESKFLTPQQSNFSQASGAVFAYNLTTNQLKFSILCNFPQASFGHSLVLKDDLLVVGAPSQSNINSTLSYYHGSVFIYNINDLTINTFYKDNKAFIRSYDHRSRFGHRVDFVNNYLAVSAPQYSYPPHIEEGRLYVFGDIRNFSGEIDIESTKLNAFCHMNGSRFGDRFIISKKDIVISAPYASYLDYNAGQISFIDIEKYLNK